MINVLIVSFSYVAALVGAGFASGQEIISFFVKYGKTSILGLVIASVAFGLMATAITAWCVEEKEFEYSGFLDKCMGKKANIATQIITLVFGLAVFCAMASGCGEMGYALFGIDVRWGILAICLVCCIAFILGTDGAMEINAVLGAGIVVGIISICLYILTYREHQTFSLARSVVSSLSYSGYNLITAPCVLVPLSARLRNKTEAVYTGLVSGCTMFVMMLLMWLILSIYYGEINLGEIPMLTMAMRQNRAITVIYSVLLLLALLSTAISNGIGCINILKSCTGFFTAACIVLGCGLFFARAGFGNLIDKVYRICGYAGVFPVVYILIKILNFFKKHRKSLKNRDIER